MLSPNFIAQAPSTPYPTPTVVLSVGPETEPADTVTYLNMGIMLIEDSFTLMTPLYLCVILLGVIRRYIRGRI